MPANLLLDVNELVLGRPQADFANTLKGIPIAQAPGLGQVFAGGILTENITVLDAVPPDVNRTFDLTGDGAQQGEAIDAFEPRFLAYDSTTAGDGCLWSIITSLRPRLNATLLDPQGNDQDLPPRIDPLTTDLLIDPNGPRHPIRAMISANPGAGVFVATADVITRFILTNGIEVATKVSPVNVLANEEILGIALAPDLSLMTGFTGGEGALVVLVSPQNGPSRLLFVDAGALMTAQTDLLEDQGLDFGSVDTQQAAETWWNTLENTHVTVHEFELSTTNCPLLGSPGAPDPDFRTLAVCGNRVFVVSAPAYDQGGLVRPSELLGIKVITGFATEWWYRELYEALTPENLACNAVTHRVALLYRRHEPCLSMRRSAQLHLYDEGVFHDPVPYENYQAWLDIYEPDPTSTEVSLAARSFAGIESDSLVALDGEDTADSYEFAVGSAGHARVLFVPNLDTPATESGGAEMEPALDVSVPLPPGHPALAGGSMADGDEELHAELTRIRDAATHQDPFSSPRDLDGRQEDRARRARWRHQRRRMAYRWSRRRTRADSSQSFGLHSRSVGSCDGDGSGLDRTPDPMRESSRGFPDTEYAPSPYLLLGAGPVVGIDPGLPERLVPSAVQVGTSPEFALGLPQYDGRPDLFLLNRLGASQLVATLTEEDPFVWATFHGPSVVGYWPCGMALSPSGTHLYVLGHFDRGVRVLDVEQLRTTTQHHDLDALLTEHYLEPQLDYYGNGDNPTYQVTDTLSQLASSPNGGLLLAMLNEVGEVHLLGADPNDESALIDLGAASVAPAVGWLTAIDADYAEGPGRIQGVFGEQVVPWSGDVNSYEIEVWLFLKESNAQPATIERHVFSDTDGHLLTGSWLLDDFDQTNDDAEFPADSDYPNRLLFYSAVSSELFVGHTVWHYDPVTDELVFHRFLTADGTEPSGLNPLLAHRVLREDPDGALWAQRSISEGTPSEMHMEHVLALLRDDPGDGSGGYVVPVPEEELFKTPLVKSGWAERGGAFLFSRPHRPWIWRWDPP